jgi:hypothetical protein
LSLQRVKLEENALQVVHALHKNDIIEIWNVYGTIIDDARDALRYLQKIAGHTFKAEC